MTAATARLPGSLGVDVGAALNLVGALVKYLALAFLLPVVVALWYSEAVWPFLAAGAITPPSDAAVQWTIVAFMALAGSNFVLMYRALVRRNPGAYARDQEFRLYGALLFLGAAVILVELLHVGLYQGEEAVRHAVFQAISLMTTTGYATATSTIGRRWRRWP